MSTSKENPYDVFISYNREIDTEVKTLYYELTVTHNLSVWLDEFEIMPNSLRDDFAKGIKASKIFICCVTKSYCDSAFCIDEITYAKKLKKKMVVLMLEKVNEMELKSVGPIVRACAHVPVYEYEQKILEPSTSELYKSIISIILFKINEADHQVFENSMSALNVSSNEPEESSRSQLSAVRTLNSHPSAIFVVENLSNDRLASGGGDSTIKLWDLTSYEVIKSLVGHTDNVTNLKAIEDNKLVSGSNDSNIIIWSLITYDMLKILKGHSSSISCIKELPEKNIATCSYDCTIRIWCCHTYQCLKVIEKFKPKSKFKSIFSRKALNYEGHKKPVFCLKVASNSRLVSGSDDNSIKVWDLNDFSSLATLSEHTGLVITLKNLSNNRLASASFDKTIKIWDMANYVCMQTLTGHNAEVQCLTVLPDNQLASAGCDYDVKIWDLNGTSECLKTFHGHSKNVNIMKQLSNNRLITFSNDNQIKLWDFKSLKYLETYNEHSKCVSSVSMISPNRFASGSWDKAVKVWTFN